jgi:hypothetical protein
MALTFFKIGPSLHENDRGGFAGSGVLPVCAGQKNGEHPTTRDPRTCIGFAAESAAPKGNMTTSASSQFPRPDFHRQVQRHYGLQYRM